MTICTAPDKAAAAAITQSRGRIRRRSVGSVGHATPPAHSRAVLAIIRSRPPGEIP